MYNLLAFSLPSFCVIIAIIRIVDLFTQALGLGVLRAI